jgi:hypothetical protein
MTCLKKRLQSRGESLLVRVGYKRVNEGYALELELDLSCHGIWHWWPHERA